MSLNTARKRFSCILSNLRLSDALMNNRTIKQYFNPGRITDLKRRYLVFSGSSFLIFVRTPILELGLEHINLTCSLKLSLLSRTTPNNFREFMLSISSSSTVHISPMCLLPWELRTQLEIYLCLIGGNCFCTSHLLSLLHCLRLTRHCFKYCPEIIEKL